MAKLKFAGRLKSLVSLPRYDYQVWSEERLLSDGQGTRGAVIRELELFLDDLHHHNEAGDGFTLMISKVGRH